MPDDSALLHADQTYNPATAREYYLRTRHLKGRRKGGQSESTFEPKGNTKTSERPRLKIVKPPILTSKQRQEAVNARVSAIRVRLNHLHDVLAKLLKQAEAKSGTKGKDGKPDSKPSSKEHPDKKTVLTSKQKSEATKRSKDFYEKHKKLQPKDNEKAVLSLEIKDVRERIHKIRAELKDALEKARAQTVKPKTVKGR